MSYAEYLERQAEEQRQRAIKEQQQREQEKQQQKQAEQVIQQTQREQQRQTTKPTTSTAQQTGPSPQEIQRLREDVTTQLSKAESDYLYAKNHQSEYTEESFQKYESEFKDYQSKAREFLDKGSLQALKQAYSPYKPTLTQKQIDKLRESDFTAYQRYIASEKGTKSIERASEAFIQEAAKQKATYSVTVGEGEKAKTLKFSDPDALTRYVNRLEEPYIIEAQTAKQTTRFRAIPGPASAKGIVDLTPFVNALDDYGVKMNQRAIEEKLKGNSLAAGILYASGAAVRFTTGSITGPLHTPELVYTLATEPAKVGEALVADPLVTAMTLATLGLSAGEIAKSLNKRFGITNKAYAAKLADSAFEIITNEDRALYYPSETQMPGSETIDFPRYAADLEKAQKLGIRQTGDYYRLEITSDPVEVFEANPQTIKGKPGTWKFDAKLGKLVYQYDAIPDIIFSQVSDETTPVKIFKKNATLDIVTSEQLANAEIKWLNTITQQQYDEILKGLKLAKEASGEIKYQSNGLSVLTEQKVVSQRPGTFTSNEATLQIIYTPPDTGLGSFPVIITPAMIRILYKDTDIAKLSDRQIFESAPILLNYASPREVDTLLKKLDKRVISLIIPSLGNNTLQRLSAPTLLDAFQGMNVEERNVVTESLTQAQIETLKQIAPENIVESLSLPPSPPTHGRDIVERYKIPDTDKDEIMDRLEYKQKSSKVTRFRVNYGGITQIVKARTHHEALLKVKNMVSGRHGYADILRLPSTTR